MLPRGSRSIGCQASCAGQGTKPGRVRRHGSITAVRARGARHEPQFLDGRSRYIAIAEVCRRLDGIPSRSSSHRLAPRPHSAGEPRGAADDIFRSVTHGRASMPRTRRCGARSIGLRAAFESRARSPGVLVAVLPDRSARRTCAVRRTGNITACDSSTRFPQSGVDSDDRSDLSGALCALSSPRGRLAPMRSRSSIVSDEFDPTARRPRVSTTALSSSAQRPSVELIQPMNGSRLCRCIDNVRRRSRLGVSLHPAQPRHRRRTPPPRRASVDQAITCGLVLRTRRSERSPILDRSSSRGTCDECALGRTRLGRYSFERPCPGNGGGLGRTCFKWAEHSHTRT